MLKIVDKKDRAELLERMESRTLFVSETIEASVSKILHDVRTKGDDAVRGYTKLYDKVVTPELEVSPEEMEAALGQIPFRLKEALIRSKMNVEAYHEKQLQSTFQIEDDTKLLKQIVKPFERVGVYVPGGKAAYPSTVLMNVIPAKIAGVKEIIMVTPPNQEGKIAPAILAAAQIAGVTRIFKVGGAQAIGALAYGTESVPKVDKIVGPGNMYVACAKKLVLGQVGIDMIAGPTEVVIVADETANPKFVAADLIAQAEHDEMASSVLITTSLQLADLVCQAVEVQLQEMPRREIVEKSFQDYGGILLVDNLMEGIEIVNHLAPEHVEIMTENAMELSEQVLHAGGIFIGSYTPESVGDYYAGTNHTLPTNGTARFFSPLGVTDFQRKTSVVYYSKEALKEAQPYIETIAFEEGLFGHQNAVTIRFKEAEQ